MGGDAEEMMGVNRIRGMEPVSVNVMGTGRRNLGVNKQSILIKEIEMKGQIGQMEGEEEKRGDRGEGKEEQEGRGEEKGEEGGGG